MPRYHVRHAYRAARDGQVFGPWEAGQVVDLADDDAAWVLRDSPGALAPVNEPAPEPVRQQPKPADRQHRGGRNRGLR